MFNQIVPRGVDADAFIKAMESEPAVSLKLNRRKASGIDDIGYGDLVPVKWCRNGFYLEERPKFTLNPLLHAGLFYVQDASSMIYETIVEWLIKHGELSASPAVLDLCAAPGGKTTSMINALPDSALVVANEYVAKRASILLENLIKWGFPSTVVTNSPVSSFTSLGESFDLVAVDAPCSGEGMMRKDEKARAQWTPGLVRQCATLQREILVNAVKVLNPGGFLIYSTCTFNLTENEENLRWLVEHHGLEPIDVKLPADWGIMGALSSQYPAMRFMPHLTQGEGLFVALLRKPGVNRRVNLEKLKDKINRRLKILYPTPIKDKDFRPDASLPLRNDFAHGSYPSVSLTEEQALSYLRRESIGLPEGSPKGFIVVYYRGHPLGFVKNIGNRANNLYPAEWRIRNL